MARLAICLVLLVSVVQGHHDKYEGHKLYRVAGPSQDIAELEGSLDILSATPAARSESGHLEAIVRLSPEEREKWLQYFLDKNMSYTKIADNLADILREEEAKVTASRHAAKRSGRSMTWDTYYRYNENLPLAVFAYELFQILSKDEYNDIKIVKNYVSQINDYLDELGRKYPDVVTVINAALSYDYRQIKYVRISTTRFEDLRKPVIVIDAAAHAREWVTPPVALFIINNLVVDIVDKKLTDSLDWVIIPMVNPDGYEYSFDVDRMWRKTRSTAHPGAERCPGVDVNRNFDHYWGTRPQSADPCSLIYEGPTPFSESETRVVRDVVLQHLSRTALYISLHSYGNMFLYAWGNNGTIPSNALSLHLAGVKMATEIDKLKLDTAPIYVVGNAAQVLYYTSGTSRDWTRAVGIPLTYTLELPGYTYGFVVPPEYIRQIITETWAGIAAGAHHVLSMYG